MIIPVELRASFSSQGGEELSSRPSNQNAPTFQPLSPPSHPARHPCPATSWYATFLHFPPASTTTSKTLDLPSPPHTRSRPSINHGLQTAVRRLNSQPTLHTPSKNRRRPAQHTNGRARSPLGLPQTTRRGTRSQRARCSRIAQWWGRKRSWHTRRGDAY